MIKKLLLLLCLATPLFAQDITGAGTVGDPYILYDARDVDSIRYLGLNGTYYELGNDIDLSSIADFQVIPNDNNASIFSLDGKGYTLSNFTQTTGLDVVSPSSYCWGMFVGKSKGSLIIKNLTLDNWLINQTSDFVSTRPLIAIGFLGAVFDDPTYIKQFSNIRIINSSIIFDCTVTSFTGTSNMGFLNGKNSNNASGYIQDIIVDNCSLTVDYNTITPNAGHFIGGIVGSLWGSLENSAVKNIYFYSRTASTSRINAGGGLVGVLIGASSLSFNYVRDCTSDFGTGGAPNNFPWGWGGITGIISTTLNTNTFHQNYVANCEALGVSQNGGWFYEDNNTTTSQSVDSNYNFCDITSYAEPDTKIGSSRLNNQAELPAARTLVQLQDTSTYIDKGWDFDAVWGWISTTNNSLPFLLTEYGSIVLETPELNDVYTANDPIPITWTGDVDSVLAYYSIDSQGSWIFIDTLANGSGSFDHSAIAYAGNMYILITNLDGAVGDTSDVFVVLADPTITILHPIELTTSKSVGDTINITIATILVDSISLFYSVGDTNTWIAIELNIPMAEDVDTLVYTWTLPNIHGTIFLLATMNAISDTTDSTGREALFIGNNMPSQPWICWYNLGGNIIERRWYYDQSCGWVSGAQVTQLTSTILDDGTGFGDYLYNTCYWPNILECLNVPLRSEPTYRISGVDTIAINLEDYYTEGTSITYKLRTYYIGTDSILYCNDLRNNIDSLVIADIQPFYNISNHAWIGTPMLTVYNVQRSKIQGEYININIDVESLNDPSFIPLLIISASENRGEAAVIVPLLDYPPISGAAYDIQQLFTELILRRDYFRGIDPKARKSGR